MKRFAPTLAAAWILSPALAFAQDGESLLRALRACAAVASAPDRLSCYDHLAPQFGAPAHTAAKPAPSRKERESWFGLDDLFGGGEDHPQTTPEQFGEETVPRSQEKVAKAEEDEIDSITAKLSDYAFNPYGKFTVFLDNGQIWTQLQADSGKARFNKDPRKVTVKIERAIFGTYSMTISGNTRLFKVRRVR